MTISQTSFPLSVTTRSIVSRTDHVSSKSGNNNGKCDHVYSSAPVINDSPTLRPQPLFCANIQQILHRMSKRNFRFPAGVSGKFFGIRHLQSASIGRKRAASSSTRIFFPSGDNPTMFAIHHRLTAVRATDIVVSAGGRFDRHQHMISAHGVSHIGDGAQ